GRGGRGAWWPGWRRAALRHSVHSSGDILRPSPHASPANGGGRRRDRRLWLYQIHRFDHATPIEETLKALHDVIKAGKARYIGASSMHAWEFARALGIAEKHGWTRFVSMQNLVNLLYREEEREMLPLCAAEGIGLIPWSPHAVVAFQ